MMIEIDGDVFTTQSPYIAHGVNCVGVMGAGIAKTIRDQYPLMYQRYVEKCKNHELSAGDAYVDYLDQGKYIICNVATQFYPGPNARLEWVAQGLNSLISNYSLSGEVIAMPRIGCGIGGLQWEDVRSIILSLENIWGTEFEVWTYQP